MVLKGDYMKRYRNEWKYIIDGNSELSLKNKLQGLLKIDDHSNSSGIYVIHNIYFDDYKNTCAAKTEAGDYERFKWRIRYYENDINSLRLELKEKLYGRCHKESYPLSYIEYKAIMNMDTSMLWDTESDLLKLFLIDLNCGFRPKVIIEYEREAYVDTTLNNRVTFDKNISCSYEFDKFLEGNYIKFPIQKKGICVLEVKFDDIFPGYLKRAINKECTNQTAFSKYYNGLKMIEVLR